MAAHQVWAVQDSLVLGEQFGRENKLKPARLQRGQDARRRPERHEERADDDIRIKDDLHSPRRRSARTSATARSASSIAASSDMSARLAPERIASKPASRRASYSGYGMIVASGAPSR